MTNCIVEGPRMCGKTHHAKELAEMLACATIVEADDIRFSHEEWSRLKSPILILTKNHEALPVFMRRDATVRQFENLKPRLQRGLTNPIVNRFEETENEPAK
jgi:hypothetical protein